MEPKTEEKKVTTIEGKKNTVKTFHTAIHTAISIVYIATIILSSPFLLMILIYESALGMLLIFTFLALMIVSIFVSRKLINKNKALIAYLLLLSPPMEIVAYLFITR